MTATLQFVDELAEALHRTQFVDDTVAAVVWTSTTPGYRDRWRILARAALAHLETVPDPAHPEFRSGWIAGTRWAAAEADEQAVGREPVYILDITDHLRMCADDPDRRSAVPRDMAPAEYLEDGPPS